MINGEIISVIVPIYNTSKYLDKCIGSIVNQTYSRLQVILVNDGSTDESIDICREWEKKDNRIEVVDKENGGLVSARIAGLRVAKGKYVGFVDSDDYIDVMMYEKLKETKEETGASFVYCGLRNCYETMGGVRVTDDNIPQISGVFEITDRGIDFLKRHIFMPFEDERVYAGGVCLGIYDREFISEAYLHIPISCSQGEDFICQVWMIINSNKICFLNDAYYYYNIRNDSISHGKNYNKYIEISNMIQTIENICNEYGILNQLKEAIESYMNRVMILEVNNLNKQLNMELYHFPDESKLMGKKVIIYAAGEVGQSYLKQLKANPEINIVMQVDKSIRKNGIQSPDKILEADYDILVIAVGRKSIAMDIKYELINMGINKEKIMWDLPELNINTALK